MAVNDVGDLVPQTANRQAGQHVGVMVGALPGEATEIRGDDDAYG